jgi:hypothetical protein
MSSKANSGLLDWKRKYKSAAASCALRRKSAFTPCAVPESAKEGKLDACDERWHISVAAMPETK